MAAPEKQPDANFKHIVRIANVDVPGTKQIRWALTNIKGIGINFADAVCKLAGVERQAKTGYLSTEEIEKLNRVVEAPAKFGMPEWMFNRRKDFDGGEDKHILTGTLTFVRDNDIKRLKKIRTRRGIRHMQGLPVRGQRTKAHFRKQKGKVIGVSKKKVAPGASAAAAGDKKGDKKGAEKKGDKK